MVMEIDPWPWTLLPAGLTSKLSDDAAAKQQILNRFVTGEVLLPSEWCIVSDDVFAVEDFDLVATLRAPSNLVDLVLLRV